MILGNDCFVLFLVTAPFSEVILQILSVCCIPGTRDDCLVHNKMTEIPATRELIFL